MPVEKDKVLAAIETKFKGKSITKTFKDNIASKWAAKIDSEEEIDAYIDDREELVLEAAAEADRRATEAAKKAAEKSKEPAKDDNEPKDDLPADTPEWAKAILKKNQELEAKITGFEQANKQKTIAERFKADERLKGVPERLLKRYLPSNEDDYETAVQELATDYSEIAKEQKLDAFGKDAPGAAGSRGGEGKREATKEELDGIVNKLKF